MERLEARLKLLDKLWKQLLQMDSNRVATSAWFCNIGAIAMLLVKYLYLQTWILWKCMLVTWIMRICLHVICQNMLGCSLCPLRLGDIALYNL